MRYIQFLIALHLAALAVLALPACGGGGDAPAAAVQTAPAPNPKDCAALQKLDGTPSVCL